MNPEQEDQIKAVSMIIDANGIVEALRKDYEDRIAQLEIDNAGLRQEVFTTYQDAVNQIDVLKLDMGRLIAELDDMRRPMQPQRPYYTSPPITY